MTAAVWAGRGTVVGDDRDVEMALASAAHACAARWLGARACGSAAKASLLLLTVRSKQAQRQQPLFATMTLAPFAP